MHGRSKVSLAGRLIITAIFLVTIVLPELLVIMALTAHPGRGYDLALSLVRFMLSCLLYYFMMAGHGWARWMMAFLLMMSLALVVAMTGKHAPPFAIVVGIIYIPCIVVLLCLKTVRPQERIRVRRQSGHDLSSGGESGNAEHRATGIEG